MKLTYAYRARLSSILRTLFFTGLAVLCPLLFFIDATSAACSTPNANAGAREYFTSENRMKYCDGTNWVDMMSAGTLGACSNAGRLEWDAGTSSYNYCAGTTWIQLGGSTADFGTCSGSPVIEHNDVQKALGFCNGANWRALAHSTTITCPTNYVAVPMMQPYTTHQFCVAKYEMKNVSGVATSQPALAPWVNINRNDARARCAALGANYRLISNAEWQAVVRNIASVGWNWSSGFVGVGALNRGHSDGTPAAGLAANASDNNACSGTGQTCSSTVWHAQRRTNKLSNGQIVWDFGANVSEWVYDDYASLGVSPAISAAWREASTLGANNRILFGPINTSWDSDEGVGQNYGGSGGGVQRGGDFNYEIARGVFAMWLDLTIFLADEFSGFRCIHNP